MYLTGKQASDKKLITELASQMIGPVNDVQELRGRISFNYLINGKHIFKLPSHRTETVFWERQSRNLPHLQEQLKYQIPVPKIAYLNLGKNKIMGYSYPEIKGKVITKSNFRKLPLSQKIPFFEKLSEAVDQLHQVDPQTLPAPLPSYTDTLTLLVLNNQTNNSTYLKNIEEAFRQQGILLEKSSLCHLDLHVENIVLDEKNNIVGILDWDNLCLGESFMEFHSNLYKPADLRILRNVHQQQTQEKINPQKFQCMDNLYNQISGLFALGILTHKQQKTDTKARIPLTCRWQRTLSQNTDCWTNFGRN